MSSVKWHEGPVSNALRKGAQAGIQAALENLLQASNARLPVDSGALRASGRVSAEGLAGCVSYNTPYAVAQHERRDFRHPAGGKPKFLEDAVNDPALRNTAADRVAQHLNRTLR